MSPIPRWAYPIDGLGTGWVAWLRGFLRVVLCGAGSVAVIRLFGWWALVGIPALFLLSFLLDALIMAAAPRGGRPSQK